MAIFSAIGSLIGADAQRDATRDAGRIAQQTADKAINFALGERDRTERRIAPYDDRGNIAGAYYNALLGLPSTLPAPTQANALLSPNASPMNQNGFYRGDFVGGDGREIFTNDNPDRFSYGTQALPPQYAQSPTQPMNTVSSDLGQAARDAFRTYIDNSDYGFRMGEEQNALAIGFGAGGARQSGAALKALQDRKDQIQRGYRNEYLGHLAGQQGVGLSGANALAGVSTNLVNTVGQNNQSAGTVAAQGALARGNINANLFGNLGSSFGRAAGMIFGGGGF